MRKAQIIHIEQLSRVETQMTQFSLQSLLPPGQILDLNLEARTLSLFTGGSVLVREQQLGDNEMRVLQPILESFPRYCPYEVLLARLSSNNPTEVSIERWQQRLQEAHTRGTWQQELRPVHRALASLRPKLRRFGLAIANVHGKGCHLISLPS